jgi:AraC family transcriptional regulator
MGCINDRSRNYCRTPLEHGGRRDRFSTLPAIADEVDWRTRPSGGATSPSDPQVVATRWQSLTSGMVEVEATTAADLHVVKIALRNMNVRLAAAGRTVLDGVAAPGTFHVTPPSVSVRGVFRGAYDALHLFVPNALFSEFDLDMPSHAIGVPCSGGEAGRDPILEWLGRSLLEANKVEDSSGRVYVDSLSMAIVARLQSIARRSVSDGRSKSRGLPRWRLRRAIDYVESQLAEPINLGDIASATGLTRMHFAAEFRASTGLRPHEYLLRRRIERSQELLRSTNESLVNIALAVGFQTQSHFSSVFKRFVGQTPRVWWLSQCDKNASSSCVRASPGASAVFPHGNATALGRAWKGAVP